MSTKEKWGWPVASSSPEFITEKLGAALESNLNYKRDRVQNDDEGWVMGFPGTNPVTMALEATKLFLPTQANNIGLHTRGEIAEMGFCGTQKLEMEFVYSLANLLGSYDPEAEVDGYICNGGTDGNDHGMWLGRNWLWANVNPGPSEERGIAVLTSFLTHYSVQKGFARLLGGEETSSRGGNRLLTLPTDKEGRLSPATLEAEIRWCFANGYRRFLIFLTAGTINIGSIDPITEIDALLSRLEQEFCRGHNNAAGFYVHVDAAYGGLVIPFVRPDIRFGFENPRVRSISVDAHKMGYTPYSAGVFLCRKGLLELTATDAEYIFGHVDYTVPGSRSGATAAACWAAMHSLGFKGYQERLGQCMDLTKHLRQQFAEARFAGKIYLFPSDLNILTIMPAEPFATVLRRKEDGGLGLCQKYTIPEIKNFPMDLTDPFGSGKVSGTVYRFLIMPHCQEVGLDRFIEELYTTAAAAVSEDKRFAPA